MNDNYTDEEIRTMYRNAKNKNQMLSSILPDLTLKPRRVLEKIIFEAEQTEVQTELKQPTAEQPKPAESKKAKTHTKNKWYVSVSDHPAVEEMTAQGLTEKEIGAKLGYTEAAVKRAIKEIGDKKTSAKGRGVGIRGEETEIRRAAISEGVKEQVRELKQNGVKAEYIAEELKIGESTVWRILKEAGLTRTKASKEAENITSVEETSQGQKEEKREVKRMKQAKKYYCELCEEHYDTKEEAKECRDRHVDLSEFDAEQVYIEDMDVPSKIVFKISGSTIEYFHKTELGQ